MYTFVHTEFNRERKPPACEAYSKKRNQREAERRIVNEEPIERDNTVKKVRTVVEDVSEFLLSFIIIFIK